MTQIFALPVFLLSAFGFVVSTALHMLGFSFFELRPLRPKFWQLLGVQIVAQTAWGLPIYLVVVWLSGLTLDQQLAFYASSLSALPALLDRYMALLLGSQALYFLVLWAGTKLIRPAISAKQAAQALVPLGIIGAIMALATIGPPLYLRSRLSDGWNNNAAPHHVDSQSHESDPVTTPQPHEPASEGGDRESVTPEANSASSENEDGADGALRRVPSRFTDDDFNRFEVRIFAGNPSMPDFEERDRAYREYRTRLTESLAKGENYAGHYRLIEFGCGMGCILAYVVDLKTGAVGEVPFSGDQFPYLVLDYRPNSSMLVALWTTYLEGGGKICSMAGAFISNEGIFQVTKPNQYAPSPEGLCEYPDGM
jgi:hypothetical protein